VRHGFGERDIHGDARPLDPVRTPPSTFSPAKGAGAGPQGQERWCAVKAPASRRARPRRARFECGKLVERDPVLEATWAADDTPVQPPAASSQPVNNAA
jgi:hypothetical protein